MGCTVCTLKSWNFNLIYRISNRISAKRFTLSLLASGDEAERRFKQKIRNVNYCARLLDVRRPTEWESCQYGKSLIYINMRVGLVLLIMPPYTAPSTLCVPYLGTVLWPRDTIPELGTVPLHSYLAVIIVQGTLVAGHVLPLWAGERAAAPLPLLQLHPLFPTSLNIVPTYLHRNCSIY